MTTPFFAYLPDHTDKAALRKELHPAHAANLKPFVEKGVIKSAGALLSDKQLKEGEEPEVIGSTVIILAEDLATARKVVETDPYWLNGVWNKEKVVFTPYISFV